MWKLITIVTFVFLRPMKIKLHGTLLLFSIFLLACANVLGQNTVGTLVNTSTAYEGYTLFTSRNNTYLINNCGQLINQWTSENLPGRSIYLLPNGNLLRAEQLPNEFLSIPGMGGKLTMRDWDNNLLWEYDFSDDKVLQHHDYYPLDNGNILVLMLQGKTMEEAIQAGRDPSLMIKEDLYNEKILEIQPVSTNQINIVWEWNFWDHLVQEFDETKDNYASVQENPQLLDINFLGFSNGNNNWLHVNSVQYNKALDQIIISARQMNEIYVIDHSTTTGQAASHSGGRYGRGGDFLYRWGNPIAYQRGEESDRKLFGQHYAHWIPEGLTDEGKIILFNNGFQRSSNFSSVDILVPPMNPDGSYALDPGEAYGPADFEWTYTDPDNPENFYSRVLSGAQRLPNGNTLICEGTSANFFEIDPNNEIVWQYISPISSSGEAVPQGGPTDDLEAVFRAEKYPVDYPAFQNRDMTPGDPIEPDFNLDLCTVLSTPEIENPTAVAIANPVEDWLILNTPLIVERIEVYNVQGQKILVAFQEKSVNFTSIPAGIYFVKIFTDRGLVSRKIIKS